MADGALGGVAVVLLGGEHADELAAAVAQVAEFEDFLGRQGTHDGGDDLAEMGEDGGVDGVGLGELSDALGEVADLAGVDDDGGQAGGEQGADRGLLVGAGRFEDDALRREGSHPGDELFDACGGVVEALRWPRRAGHGHRGSLCRHRRRSGCGSWDETPESDKGATRADGVPVRAGECGVGPQ